MEELKGRGISDADPRVQLLLRLVRYQQIQSGEERRSVSKEERQESWRMSRREAKVLSAQLGAFSSLSHGVTVSGETMSVLRKHVEITEQENGGRGQGKEGSGGTGGGAKEKANGKPEKLVLREKQLDKMIEKLEEGSEWRKKAEEERRRLALWALQRGMRREVALEMDRLVSLHGGADLAQAFTYSVVHTVTPELAGVGERVEQPKRSQEEWIGSSARAHRAWVHAVLLHHRTWSEHHERVSTAKKKLFKRLQKWKVDRERRETVAKEKLERERFAALKRNDETAYLALLAQTKNKRLMHLIQQTDAYLQQIGDRVQETQNTANEALRTRFGDTMPADSDSMDAKSQLKQESLLHQEAQVKPENAETGDSSSDAANASNAIQKTPYYLQIHRVQEKIEKQPSILVGGALKEYQMDGLNWLVSLFNNRLSGILADEMGLGKTIQTIALISHLYETKKMRGPFLVVVPLSTLSNWALEFQKWAPAVYAKMVAYKGMPQARKRIWQTQLLSGRNPKPNAANKAGGAQEERELPYSVVLTTFDYVIKDRTYLQRIKWAYIIVDEGHRMKNHNCKLSTTLSQHYDSQFRLILTGTPLQNSLPELWSLLNFLLPSLFHSVENFEKWFNKPFANTGEEVKMNEEESMLVIQRLHKVLRPFLLRRLKTQVEAQLPEKIERIIKVDMSAWQRRLYEHANRGILAFKKSDGSVATTGVLNSLMQLRKVCDHPYMFSQMENVEYDDTLWRSAGKFELLDRILPKLKACGHRVLMFSQFTSALDILEIYFKYRDISYLRLDGTTKAESRGELLAEFNAPDSPYFMFILSTRAGGLGLNLQTADTVILFDSDWNPQADLQAQDRAHRIGQKNDVLVLRLVTQNSVEEKILEAANYKLDLDSKIIQAGMFNKDSNATDRRAYLMNLLKEAGEDDENEMKDVPDNKQVNALISRSDREYRIFQQMDRDAAEEERRAWLAAGNLGQPPPRLMTDDELPDWLKIDFDALQAHSASQSTSRPRIRRPTAITGAHAGYSGPVQMTDEQFMKMVENEEEGNTAFSKEAFIDAMMGDTAEDDTFEDPDVMDEDWQASSKKRKFESISSLPNVDNLRLEMHDILNAVTTFDDGRGYAVAYPFMEVPTEEIAPGYFSIIKTPMSFNLVRNRIYTYNTMQEFERDVQQIFTNAHVYNQEGSQICLDASSLSLFFRQTCDQFASQRDNKLSRMQYDYFAPSTTQQPALQDSPLHSFSPYSPSFHSSALDTLQPHYHSNSMDTSPNFEAAKPSSLGMPKKLKISVGKNVVSKPVVMRVPVVIVESSEDEEEDDGFADTDLRGTGQSFGGDKFEVTDTLDQPDPSDDTY